MNIQQINFFDRLKEVARSHSQSIALINDEKRILYGEIPEKIIQLVNGMHSSGIKKGDRVALLLNNSIEYILLVAAGFKLGSICVCINTRTGADEVKKVIQQTRPRVLIYDPQYQEVANLLKGLLPLGILSVNSNKDGLPSIVPWWDSSSKDPNLDPPSIHEGAIIIPTAAVGGIPKGALLSQNNILSSVLAHLIHFGEEPMSGLLSLLVFQSKNFLTIFCPLDSFT